MDIANETGIIVCTASIKVKIGIAALCLPRTNVPDAKVMVSRREAIKAKVSDSRKIGNWVAKRTEVIIQTIITKVKVGNNFSESS